MAQNDKTRQLLLENNDLVYKQNEQLNNVIKILEETSDTAANTNLKLNEQGQKIKNISDTNKEIRQETRRADRTTNQIMRREFCHRALLYLIAFCLLITIIALVILKLTKKK